MKSSLKSLTEQARRKPLGNSWTYATSAEFEQRLARLLVLEIANVICQYDELTVGQGYLTAKYIKKYFEIE